MEKKKEKIIKPELVAPAGDWASLHTAIEYGADAVYFGTKELNMRHLASNFDLLEIKKVMSLLLDKGKKGYLTLNTILYNNEIDTAKKILDHARKAKVDAVIAWDMGIFTLAKEAGLRVHLSTQASVSNFPAVKYYSSLGVKRIVLARECRLTHIRQLIEDIKKENLDVQIEIFVHGAMCVSLSGRCFLSEHSFSKSANQGKCLQPCRREYLISEVDEKNHRYILGKDYVLSPNDLCTIDFIDKLIETGISAFKIEGRMRSPEYVREVTLAYRQGIDAFAKGTLDNKMKKDLRRHLELTYNRGLNTGFLLGDARDTGSKTGTSQRDKIFLGEVVKYYKRIGVAAIKIMNARIKKGQEILIYGKNTPACVFQADEIHLDKAPVEEAGKGTEAGIKVPFRVRRNDKVFSLAKLDISR